MKSVPESPTSGAGYSVAMASATSMRARMAES